MSRQFRFVHAGVAAGLAAVAITTFGVITNVGAAVSSSPTSFVPIVPCRLADTRLGDDHVGVHATAIGPAETVNFAVWGINGNCTIPATATGIATNVTAVNPTAASFLTIYPADATTRPTASNLNYTATSSPTPNQVTVGLSATGAIAAFNNGGTVDVIIDIVGYYQSANTVIGANVQDGSLGARDVGEFAGELFDMSFGTISGHSCKTFDSPSLTAISGTQSLLDDVIIVTPKAGFPTSVLVDAQAASANQVKVIACNQTAGDVVVGTRSFNYVSIDTAS